MGDLDLEQLSAAAAGLANHFQSIANRGSAYIMGVDFGEFAGLVAQSNIILANALRDNANTGIGLARSIAILTEACEDEGIVP